MRIFLFLLIVILPVAELYGLIWAGGEFGAWLVIGWVLLAAAAGVYILGRQGGEHGLRRFRQTLGKTGQPLEALLYSLLLVVAAILLIIPGLLTDTVGLLLLLPPLRHWLTRRLGRHFIVLAAVKPQATQSTLEGEYRREEETVSQIRPPNQRRRD